MLGYGLSRYYTFLVTVIPCSWGTLGCTKIFNWLSTFFCQIKLQQLNCQLKSSCDKIHLFGRKTWSLVN